MSRQNSSNGALRFGALVRVSTDHQEQQGESLRTQRSGITHDIELLGGTAAAWYGGQEHATEGWERKEVDRLIADAGKGLWNAVIVANADRWSRDNKKSSEGLEAFKRHGIRFFVGVSEYDLYNPEHVLFLDLSASIGRYHASNQKKKSILNRIHRARRGIPTVGKLPFGRTFDRESETWGLDPEKVEVIQDIAARYLQGTPLRKLARKHGLDHSTVCRVLRGQLGEEWELEFEDASLGIREAVLMRVPRLLSPDTVRAVLQRMKANREHFHRPPESCRVHEYLLSGFIFCAACGYNLVGEAVRRKRRGKSLWRYYRHPHTDRTRPCPLTPRPWVRADPIEAAVVGDLMNLFVNPDFAHEGIVQGIAAAAPDAAKAHERLRKAQEDLGRVGASRQRILTLVSREALTMEQAEEQLRKLQDRERELRVEVENLRVGLGDVPDPGQAEAYAAAVRTLLADAGAEEVRRVVEPHLAGETKRGMLEAVFGRALADGTPAGVYVSPEGEYARGRPKTWGYKLKGRLEFETVSRFGMPRSLPSTSPAPTPARRSASPPPCRSRPCSS
jgi:DNA invertase Pin-like site-specific DNA recombinase